MSDAGLSLCSLAAQGLWMRCLCVAAQADPIGYVVVNGRGLSAGDLARMVKAPESEVDSLLSELESNGVFSRDRRGFIYSRRMIRDAKKRTTARENGKHGGNPRLRDKTDNSALDNQLLENPPNQRSGTSHKPEAISQQLEGSQPPSSETSGFNNSGKINGAADYAFQHGCVRLMQADLERWQKAFGHVSVEAELMAAEPWLKKQKSWFQAAAGLLAKREREMVRGPPSKELTTSHPRDSF